MLKFVKHFLEFNTKGFDLKFKINPLGVSKSPSLTFDKNINE